LGFKNKEGIFFAPLRLRGENSAFDLYFPRSGLNCLSGEVVMQHFTSFTPFVPSALTPYRGPKPVRVLFDESHSESWTIDRKRAEVINPSDAINSSYQSAAEAIAVRDCSCFRNLDQPLVSKTLEGIDLLALIHPCDPQWEKTVSTSSPRLTSEEIRAIQSFVEAGGSLLVISEYEHGKYGDNLNELLSVWGITLENTTVLDRQHCAHENHAWVMSEATSTPEAQSLAHLAPHACFYQAGSCLASGKASIVRRSLDSAHPSHAGLIAIASPGKGRVAVVTDSRIFGDEFIDEWDHKALWLNLIHWLSVPAYSRHTWGQKNHQGETTKDHPAWISLKEKVNLFRKLQNPDGSVSTENHPQAIEGMKSILQSIQTLAPLFSHQSDYWPLLQNDLLQWQDQGFPKADFKRSLGQFQPQKNRIEGIQHISLFPMYTPNGSLQIRLEAILFGTPWPEWIAALEKTRFTNPKFVPGELIDYTEGYQSDCAVLFPETVSITGKPVNAFGTIFCDREAQRLLHYTQQALQLLNVIVPPRVEALLCSPVLAQQTLELWDLIHDQAHSLGELPFDPFMIRQRSPYWMYSLEELRVDLRAFGEAHRMGQNDFPFAEYVTYAILFDRIFRFPIVGTRVRNYDGLGGQILFSSLHQSGVLRWCDNQLFIDWLALPQAIADLENEIAFLYRNAADSSKIAFWLDAHDLVSRHVKPNIASQWKKESRVVNSEEDPAQWLKLILDDEFPLGQFHLNLQKKIIKS
jgi:hypothetical protein